MDQARLGFGPEKSKNGDGALNRERREYTRCSLKCAANRRWEPDFPGHPSYGDDYDVTWTKGILLE